MDLVALLERGRVGLALGRRLLAHVQLLRRDLAGRRHRLDDRLVLAVLVHVDVRVGRWRLRVRLLSLARGLRRGKPERAEHAVIRAEPVERRVDVDRERVRGHEAAEERLRVGFALSPVSVTSRSARRRRPASGGLPDAAGMSVAHLR